jgi:DNA end-binding protein Ku
VIKLQSIWSGNLAFGTILIPVRLYGATTELRVPFHEVHLEDAGRVRHKKFCEVCGRELHGGDVVKGYEVADRMITFTDDELDALRPVVSRSMHILGFCYQGEVPVLALDQSYYLGTEKVSKGHAGEPFTLLREALLKSGQVAIVSWTTRASEHIGMLMPHENGFVLKGLLYARQIRPFGQVEIEEEPVETGLIDKGVQYIENRTFRFDYGSYEETYSRAVRDIIEAKAMGRAVKVEPSVQKSEAQSIQAELDRMLA